MAKKERAPKKEKPTKRDKEIFKKSVAERRENRKSRTINAIVTVVVVLLLVGVSTLVGIFVKDTPSNPSDADNTAVHDRDWILNLLKDYDGTISYLTGQGYTAGTDFVAEYDESRAEENNGLVGSIKSVGTGGIFEIYYFAETSDSAAKAAQAYYNVEIAPRKTADEELLGINRGGICIVGKGDKFQTLIWQYYVING